MASSKGIDVPVTGNTAPLRKSLTRAEKQLQQFSANARREMTSAARSFAVTGGAVAAMGVAVTMNAEQARIANRRLAQLAATSGLFGNESGKVTQRLSAYAGELERTTAVEAEAIKEAQGILLTFKKIAVTATVAGSAFDRATQAALDMAGAGFGTAQTNAVQLGKALEDPIKGINALARSGITFTEQEKAKIKALVESNKMLEAQGIILDAIEGQVLGAAAATASSTAKMRVSLGQVGDVIGGVLLPAFDFLSVKAQAFGQYAEQNRALVAGLTTALLTSVVAFKAVRVAVTTTTVVMTALPAISAAVVAAYTAIKVAAGLAAVGNFSLAASALAVQASTVVGIATATAAAIAIGVLTAKVMGNANAMDNLAASTYGAKQSYEELYKFAPFVGRVLTQFDELVVQNEQNQKAASDKAKQAEKQRWESFKNNLKTAQEAIREYVASISEAIGREVSLSRAVSDAARSQQDAQDGIQEALKNRARAYEDLDQAKANRDASAYAKALQDIKAAEDAVTAAQQVKPKSYTEVFKEQIAAAKEFAGYAKQLIAAGIGKAGLAQILDLGPVAGVQVAKDLLAGTAGLTVSDVRTSLQEVADVGTAAGMATPGAKAALEATAGKTGTTYNVTVNAGVGDKNEIAKQVVELLQSYEKRFGSVPIKVKK